MSGRGIILAIVAAGVVAAYVTHQPTKEAAPGAPAAAALAASPAIAQAPAPTPAPRPAQCAAADFKVEGFSSRIFDDCRASSCPSLKLTGRLVNGCSRAAGAQLKITALDQKGGVVDTAEGWPASIRNISPGEKYAFDLGPLMQYRKEMKTFEVQVIHARTW